MEFKLLKYTEITIVTVCSYTKKIEELKKQIQTIRKFTVIIISILKINPRLWLSFCLNGKLP